MFRDLFALAARVVTLMALGHCDIPCGIYDPKPMQLAAKTVETMVTKIRTLPVPNPTAVRTEWEAYQNAMSRMVLVKEEHAQLCKKELLILWTDFLRDEHLAQFPDLHSTFWRAAKLCSHNKQVIDPDAAEHLVAATDRIAEIFHGVKGA